MLLAPSLIRAGLLKGYKMHVMLSSFHVILLAEVLNLKTNDIFFS
jgi:hypothetical protein